MSSHSLTLRQRIHEFSLARRRQIGKLATVRVLWVTVLGALTLVYLGAVCFAAGEGRVLLERVWVPLPAWGVGLGYVALFAVLVVGTLATKALGVSRPLETFRVLRGSIWVVFV